MSRLERMIRFVAVAEELSFSRAARRLNVDQPWLSRQVQKLEADLGFPLFIRTTRKVELTPKGLVLFEQAREIAASVDKTLDLIKVLSRSEQTATLGVQPVSFWVPGQQRLIDEFEARHPDTHLHVTPNYTSDLFAKIKRRLIDAAVVPAGPDGPPPEFEALCIDRQRMRLLIPCEHPLADKPLVRLEDLSGFEIVTFDRRINPKTYEDRYGQLVRAGAIPVVSPEAVLGPYYTARRRRLILPAFAWPEADKTLGPEFVQAATDPGFPVIDHWLVRRREAASRPVEWMWTLGSELAAGIDPALAHAQ